MMCSVCIMNGTSVEHQLSHPILVGLAMLSEG